MAANASAYGTFGGRPAYRIHIYVRRDVTDTANNRATYAWAMYAQKTGEGSAWTTDAYAWAIDIGGFTWSGSAAALDFRSTNQNTIAAGVTGWMTHNSDGNKSFNFAGWYHTSANFGNADITNTLFVTDRIAKVPSAPNPGTPDTITSTSMRLQYAGVNNNGSAYLEWQVQRATDSAFTVNAAAYLQAEGSAGTIILTGLSPKTLYYLRVRGRNAVGWGPWSIVRSARTHAVPDTPATPVFLLVGSTNVAVTLTDPANNGSGITSRWSQISTSSSFASILSEGNFGNTPNWGSSHGIKRNTDYYVRWRAQNAYGWSGWSGTYTDKTPLESPSTPSGYTAHHIASRTAYSTVGTIVDNGGAALSQLNYQLNTSASTTGATDVTLDSAREPLFTGLSAGTVYYYRLRVANPTNWGAWGSWVAFTTRSDVPSPPTGLATSAIGNTNVTLSWVAPGNLHGSTIIGYRVSVGTNKTVSADAKFVDVGPTELSAVLTGLKVNAQYYAKVMALSSEGEGSTTDILAFRTTNAGGVASPLWLNVSGTWKQITLWLNVSGTWKQITLWLNVSGTWRG